MITRNPLSAAVLLALASPSLAAPNSYGGYDVAGPNQANEERYASSVRGWDVFKAHDTSRHAYCVAVGDRGTRLGYDGKQWQLAVPVKSRKDWQGRLEIDGKVDNYASGTAVDGWTILWLGAPELDRLKAGKQAILGIGKADYDFSLAGAAAAVTKVEECQAKQGNVAAKSAAPTPAGGAPAAVAAAPVQAPAPAAAQPVLNPTFEACQPPGSVKTTRNGPATSVTFRVDNSVKGALNLFWIDQNGRQNPYGQIAAGKPVKLNTYVGHLWMATDGHSCAYQEVEAGAGTVTFVVDAPPAKAGNAAPAPAAPAPAATGGAKAGKLPVTGLSPAQAAALIGAKPKGDAGAGMDLYAKCRWEINETPFMDMALLYYAASCKGRISKLDYAGGAHYSQLKVIDSAFAAYSKEPFTPSDNPLVWVTDPGVGDVRANVLARVRSEMDDPAMKKKCGILPAAETGLPADHIVVGLLPTHRKEKPEYSEPYGAVGLCGRFGERDTPSFWRVFQGQAWFFDLGPDAAQDVDAGSLTLISPDGKGGWKKVQ